MAELTPVQKAQAEEAARINAAADAAMVAVAALHPNEQLAALNNALLRLRSIQAEQNERAQLAALKAKYPEA